MSAMSAKDEMLARARAMMDHAYVPYSAFHVGACVRGESGALYAGCNVQNAAFPQGWCAETSAIAAMVAAGERRIVEVVVAGARADGHGGYADDPGVLCTPCGGCRQKLREFAGDDLEVHVAGAGGFKRTFTLGELLPASFGPDNLGGG